MQDSKQTSVILYAFGKEHKQTDIMYVHTHFVWGMITDDNDNHDDSNNKADQQCKCLLKEVGEVETVLYVTIHYPKLYSLSTEQEILQLDFRVVGELTE